MKLAASNIAWDTELNQAVFAALRENGFEGLELAPTKLYPQKTYEHTMEIDTFRMVLQKACGLSLCSMQSIWYGRTESIFGTAEERHALVDVTCEAINFADAAGIRNIVFGCPKNRCLPEGRRPEEADEFFRSIADYAKIFGIVIALEPNPAIYGTNFLNTTAETCAYVRRLAHPAIGVNLDLGAMIENGESLDLVGENLDLIHHIHISRPYLAAVEADPMHCALARLLRERDYPHWVSIEMKDAGLPALKKAIEAVGKEFLC